MEDQRLQIPVSLKIFTREMFNRKLRNIILPPLKKKSSNSFVKYKILKVKKDY